MRTRNAQGETLSVCGEPPSIDNVNQGRYAKEMTTAERFSSTFRYRDYADSHRHKTMTLDAHEFLRRFVQHVLPKSFVKVRHYGLLANCQRQARLAVCRRLLLVANVAAALPGVETALAEPPCCPHCGGTRLVYRALAPLETMPTATKPDSS
jgi:hypothetical protein